MPNALARPGRKAFDGFIGPTGRTAAADGLDKGMLDGDDKKTI
jgi:hypothetical protein